MMLKNPALEEKSESILIPLEQHASYIICATPRSGSTLLCDLLLDSAVAGNPDSFFRRESYQWWAAYLDVADSNWKRRDAFDQKYLSAVLQQGRGGTTVFGLRLMWESLRPLSDRLDALSPDSNDDVNETDKVRFEKAFGPVRYIYLSREDKVKQAISRLKAEQSGLWHMNADGSERERLKSADQLMFNAERINELVTELSSQDKGWKRWFSQQHIQPLCLTYEALSRNPKNQLKQVLVHIGQDPEAANGVSPKTRKLADEVSKAWENRYARN